MAKIDYRKEEELSDDEAGEVIGENIREQMDKGEVTGAQILKKAQRYLKSPNATLRRHGRDMMKAFKLKRKRKQEPPEKNMPLFPPKGKIDI
tara:strand:+ start:293 stop:568 length:276 start_codon:yes stop_codon:yes gene_type:complete